MKKPTRGPAALGMKPKRGLAAGGSVARTSHIPGAKLPAVTVWKPSPGPYGRK